MPHTHPLPGNGSPAIGTPMSPPLVGYGSPAIGTPMSPPLVGLKIFSEENLSGLIYQPHFKYSPNSGICSFGFILNY